MEVFAAMASLLSIPKIMATLDKVFSVQTHPTCLFGQSVLLLPFKDASCISKSHYTLDSEDMDASTLFPNIVPIL